MPNRFSSGVNTGPNTAPSVPIHTTAPIAVARSSTVARSAAAYRVCRVADCPEPNRTMPTMNSQNQRACPPVAATRAPTAPIPKARARPGRRPRRRMNAARGMAATAAPRVNAAEAKPANRSLPSMSLASSETTATVPATAAWPGTTARRSTPSVRRCAAARSGMWDRSWTVTRATVAESAPCGSHRQQPPPQAAPRPPVAHRRHRPRARDRSTSQRS